jgi:putative ABC transport system permease protein
MRHGGSTGIPLPELLSLGGRNILRHGRRTLLTGATVAAACATLVFFMGYYRGTYDQMFFGAIIDYQTAHAQFQAPGLDPEDPAGWARPEASMRGWEAAVEAALGLPSVRGAAPRLEFPAWVGDGVEKAPALLAGVDCAAESNVSVFTERLVAGRLPVRGEALVGDGLAALFSLSPGSLLLVQANTSAGAPNLMRFGVSGIYDTGFSSFDSSFVALDLADAQELVDAPGAANRVYLRLSSLGALDAALPGLGAAAGLAGAVARPWSDYARDAIDHARTESVFYYVFLLILLLVASSAVASTMRVAVAERVREIATLRAGGWTRGEVFRLFAIEAAAIGAAGSAVGAMAGGLLSALLAAYPMDVSAMAGIIDYPFFEMTSSSRPEDFLLGGIVGMGSALAAGIGPARRAARTNIVKALSTH